MIRVMCTCLFSFFLVSQTLFTIVFSVPFFLHSLRSTPSRSISSPETFFRPGNPQTVRTSSCLAPSSSSFYNFGTRRFYDLPMQMSVNPTYGSMRIHVVNKTQSKTYLPLQPAQTQPRSDLEILRILWKLSPENPRTNLSLPFSVFFSLMCFFFFFPSVSLVRKLSTRTHATFSAVSINLNFRRSDYPDFAPELSEKYFQNPYTLTSRNFFSSTHATFYIPRYSSPRYAPKYIKTNAVPVCPLTLINIGTYAVQTNPERYRLRPNKPLGNTTSTLFFCRTGIKKQRFLYPALSQPL